MYQGDWQGAVVAVKKFHAWDDKSWQREYEVAIVYDIISYDGYTFLASFEFFL